MLVDLSASLAVPYTSPYLHKIITLGTNMLFSSSSGSFLLVVTNICLISPQIKGELNLPHTMRGTLTTTF